MKEKGEIGLLGPTGTLRGSNLRRPRPGLEQGMQFALEGSHIFERSVHRGKADVGNVVGSLQMLHQDFADICTFDLLPAGYLDVPFNAVHQALKFILRNGQLLKGAPQTHFELFTAVGLVAAIPFHHGEVENFRLFHGGEAEPTTAALPTPTNRQPILDEAGVHNAGVWFVASRTLHEMKSQRRGTPSYNDEGILAKRGRGMRGKRRVGGQGQAASAARRGVDF